MRVPVVSQIRFYYLEADVLYAYKDNVLDMIHSKTHRPTLPCYSG